MFSKRIISLLAVLILVAQSFVLINTDSYSNFVEDSSPLEELPEYGAPRSGHHEIENATLLKDFNPGDDGSNPQRYFAHTDGILYFSVQIQSNPFNHELWRSDGTEEGTYMVKDINPGSNSSGPSFYVSMGDIFLFAADDGTHGQELWRSDGTEEGTYMVKDIWPGNPDWDGIDQQDRANPDTWPISINDDFILFPARNSSMNVELWRSDGTEEGTYLVKEINEQTSSVKSSSPRFFRHIGDNKVIFRASDSSSGYNHGHELWVTDGTEEGTQLLKDINPGTDSSDAAWFTMMDDVYYFAAESEYYERELWRSDGTTNGTYQVTELRLYNRGLLSPALPFGDVLVFKGDADHNNGGTGKELYKYNPSTNETTIIKDFEEGSDDSDAQIKFVVGDKIVFSLTTDEYGPSLWITDGTEEGTSLFFDPEGEGYNLYMSLMRQPCSRDQPRFHTYWPVHENVGLFYFGSGANDNVWATDGTTNGTYEITHNLSSPNDGHIAGGNLFFSAWDEAHGEELRVIRNFTASTYYTLYKDKVIDPITFDYDGEGADWEIYPALPSNLSFNSEDGTITGTPDQLFSLISYTVYANGSVNETYKIKLKSVQYPDTDGDGVCDGVSAVSGICTAGPDAFPFDAAASVDTDGDGMPDTLTGNSTSEPPLVEDLDDDNDGLLDLDEIANGTEPLNPDTDGDGYCDGSGTVESCIAGDVFPLDENEWFDTDGDGTGNNADTDDDNDGLDDTTEASSDPVTNSTNPDTDGDGVCDGSVNVTINDSQICIGGPDELPTNPNETVDTDGDGIGNNEDTDDDNDGLSDDEEIVIGTDPLDPDTDGDFYCDGPIVVTGCAGSDDAFPLDDSEWLDTDGDGIGNNADPDDDGDSYDDIWENENGYDSLDGCDPNLNSSACDQDYDGLNNGEENALGTNVTNPDTDGDGFCDGDLGVEGICVAGPDDFPLDPAAHLDTDKDGMPDTLNGTSTSEPALIEDLDDDNDSLLDLDEIANGTEPLNPDTDGDGYCDGSVTVGSCIAGDVFPLDENEWFDTDGDGTGNNADTDDDNDGLNDTTEASSDPVTNSTNPDTDGDGYCDGPVSITDVCDATDAFPTDGNEWNDTDNDGTGDNADLDDDNDGLDDITEASSDPATNSTNPDTDGDGYCDGLVNITDICVATDTFPTTATEWFDTDGDGTGNNADLDDDGDGYNDTMEISEGSDPLDSENIPLDTDGDFDPDSTDLDDDNDGFDDADDAFPTNSAEWLDTDDDGTGNNADTDDDNDGIPDNWDPMPVDPDGDFDKDGILDRDEYKPNADGEPADADADGKNDMLQALASGSNTSSSDRSWKEMCCWVLLLLLLLLIPLLKKRYDNSLVYDPREIEYTIGNNDTKVRTVPSLHEYTEKYIKTVNSEGLRRITYAISGNLVEGLDIDSKTGIISGHPEKVGEYTYEIVMKHSKGNFKGEVVINVREKEKAVEEPEPEPEEEVDSKQAELDRIAAKAEAIDFGVIGTASASDKDNLKVIKGIGPFIEEKLNALGIYKVEQIAKMTSDLEDEVNLAIEFFPGRVKRDQWVKQSKEIIEE